MNENNQDPQAQESIEHAVQNSMWLKQMFANLIEIGTQMNAIVPNVAAPPGEASAALQHRQNAVKLGTRREPHPLLDQLLQHCIDLLSARAAKESTKH